MRLADFIVENRERIVAEWETFARSLFPPQKQRAVPSSALCDHAERILDAIIEDMRTPQSAAQQEAKSRGHGDGARMIAVGELHALRRLEIGFRLDQLLSEFRALRASVLRLQQQSAEPCPDEDITRFNEAIDEILAASIHHYVGIIEHHQDQFLGILGHDLRSPLSAIVLSADALVASERLDAASARGVERIQRSARRMDRLIDDLLDLARARCGGGIPIVRAPMDLGVLCRQLVDELQAAHPGRSLQFVCEGDLHGRWDSDRLAQVVSNLLANAVQHGGTKGAVSLRLLGGPDGVVLTVHNEGPPILANDLAFLFKPMTRRGHAGEKKSTNLGLGLYIAEQLVLSHAGRISVDSTEASGTTFTVYLPRRAPRRNHETRFNRPAHPAS